MQDSVAVLAVGDVNVHNEEWLRFSDGTSLEGRGLEHVCNEPGLKQQVRSPTRGRHLLDLVLLNFASGVQCISFPESVRMITTGC